MGNLSKAQIDAAIIGTNNSSIVSKRSVEKFYSHDNEHQFLRYFVRKPQRRSPIINRGYWVRMQAVDFVVRSFLEEKRDDGKKKVVVNLGCGYDPLPFQCLSRKLGGGSEVLYVDIDYPDLMTIKASIVNDEPEIKKLLTDTRHFETPEENVHFQSKEYLALGCDLRDLETVKKIFQENDITNAAILFTAEVSLTYMTREAVDNLIAMAAGLPDSRFSILEQFLPDGPNHPFARTMIKHFDKLNTPLQSISAYPTLRDQTERYGSRGYQTVTACDLLAFWDSIPLNERKRVEIIEPFDEWEEFFLFCQHYFILHATNSSSMNSRPNDMKPFQFHDGSGQWSKYANGKSVYATSDSAPVSSQPEIFKAHLTTNRKMKRRCGAAAALDAAGSQIVYHGGLAKSRLNSALLITQDSSATGIPKNTEMPSSDGRVYHTLTQIGDGKSLLIGGRTSPGKLLKDAYILDNGKWRRVQDMPEGRSRHCAVSLANGDVLVYGGLGPENKVFDSILLWSEEEGFREVEFRVTRSLDVTAPQTSDQKMKGRFSAGFCWDPVESVGYLAGGMDEDGCVLGDIHEVKFETDEDGKAYLTPTRSSVDNHPRMGHSMHCINRDFAIMVGGVAKKGLQPAESDVVMFDRRSMNVTGSMRYNFPQDRQPLLINHSTVILPNAMATCGGGGVCFSFGSCDNEGIWELSLSKDFSPSKWSFIEELAISSKAPDKGTITTNFNALSLAPENSNHSPSALQSIPKAIVTTASDFEKIITASRPVLISGVNLGPCTTAWTPSYLASVVGSDRPISVHVATTTSMSFHHKNFKYSTMGFGDFITAAESDSSHLYFRSLSSQNPTSAATNIATDFPMLANDFILPPQFEAVRKNQHSSPLRISSADVGMWLHYDAMANILCHIRGRKRLRLYPPSDVTKLSFPPGASTSKILDIFEIPSPPGTTPYDVEMGPGDVLYIPPLWLHAAKPITMCVAVNVFFRGEMERERWPEGRDVYANRDIKAYERGREKIRGLKKEFEGLPEDVRGFYLARLAEELMG